MSDPYVRTVDVIADMRERHVRIGVDHEAVTIGDFEFTREGFEELSHALLTAAWEAAANSERMRQEADGD